MDDSVRSGARLEVSVSFGRFENDALSWEKWSSFSPNKYLEEVGNLSTPGSVAQKKAYFEAHYKKIAARKAEELEQEKLMDPVKPSLDVSSKEDHIANSFENCADGSSGGEGLAEEFAQEACMTALTNVAIADETKHDNTRSSKGDEHGASTIGSIDAIAEDGEIEGATVATESASSAIEEAKDVLNVSADNPELSIKKGETLVGLETSQKDSEHVLEKPPERKNGIDQASALKKENSKLNTRNITSKVTPMKKERNLAGTKKKVVSPAAKPLQASTPKYINPASISTPVTASQSLKKKVNGSALQKSKNFQLGESKRAAPTSLHMSLSLGHANSPGALSMTRKSLIMERMGDKDIVRRAFKTFQNHTSGSTTEGKSSPIENVSSTAVEPKMSSYRTPTKEKAGLRKDAERRASQRNPSGARSNPLPSRSHRSSALDRKITTAVSPATGLRNDEKAEKRKEFLKQLGAKSIAREAKTAQHSAEPKVLVKTEICHRPTLER